MRFIAIAMLLALSTVSLAEDIITSHAIALRGEPKYKEGFKH